jgi:autotransporter-associated beta strand protein
MTAGNTDAITGTPTVFEGNYALRLNDYIGGNDISALTQSVTNFTGNKIYYAWNAVLEPSHGADDSPSFLIKVIDETTGNVVTNIAYSAFSAQNATIFRQAGNFVTTDWKVEEIDAITGHDYKMVFVAVDCLYGGHGGYVYVDGFGNAIPAANADVDFDPATDITKGADILIPIGGTPDIDLAKPFYTTTELAANQVNPNFVGGTLQVNTAGPIGTNFTVQSQGGTVDTNGSNILFSGAFTGVGAMTKIGLGTLSLSGTSAINGNFDVNAGTLNVIGALSAATVNVNSGGTLSGIGPVVANVSVNDGGTLAPGSQIGTLSVVAGDVTIAPTGTLSLDLDGRSYVAEGGPGTYDRLALTGGETEFVAGGIVAPQLRDIPGGNNTFNPVLGDMFTVVTADAVSGEFASVAQPVNGMPANRRFDVLYGSNYVNLVLTPGSFALLGETDGWRLNAVAAAEGLDTVRPRAGARNGALQSLFNGLYGFTSPQLGHAFGQISGEIHVHSMQVANSAAREASNLAIEASSAMIATPGCDAAANNKPTEEGDNRKKDACDSGNRMAIWTRFLAEGMRLDDDATSARFRNKQRGFAAGVHVLNSADTRIGIGGAYSENEISTAIGSRADVNGGSIFLYGSHDFGGGFNLSGVLGWHSAKAHTNRDLTLMSGTSTSRADYKLQSLNAAIEARYAISIGPDSVLRPVIGLTLGRTKAKGFQESNADANLALRSDGKTWSTTQSKVGAELDIGLRQKLRAHIFANWMHDLNGNSTASRLMELGAADWRVESVGIKSDTASFGIGLSAALSPSVTVRADYRGIRDFGSYNVDRGSIGVSFAF